jgi:mono/diheme cytochrome c family protein
MKIFKVWLFAAACGLFIFACSENKTGAPNQSNAVVTNANSTAPAASPAAATPGNETAEAQNLYVQNCANCHKEDGTGGKKEIDGTVINVDNLTTDKMKKMDDQKYVGYIKNGVPGEGMPAFKDRLTDAQIASVVKYIRTEIQK